MKKRFLAAPFVFTAMISPAFAGDPPPNANPPPRPNPNPPPPPQGKPEPPSKDWGQVVKRPDGTCVQLPPPNHCPPNVHCNPPPPKQVIGPAEKPEKKK